MRESAPGVFARGLAMGAADIVPGVPTTVVWAHGHDGFAMDYHARHRGTVSVTW